MMHVKSGIIMDVLLSYRWQLEVNCAQQWVNDLPNPANKKFVADYKVTSLSASRVIGLLRWFRRGVELERRQQDSHRT